MINSKLKIESVKNPIRHWIIRNFLSEPVKIKEEVTNLPYNRKECDLFQFYQGEDLKYTENKVLKELYDILSSKDFIDKVSKLTGTKLSYIDISPFIYKDTDYLLPHDDRLEDRKIAFVLYLNSLEKEDGGTLDFFEHDLVHQRIFPERGMFVMFEVSSNSIHQVAEVIKKERVTLAGWFHG